MPRACYLCGGRSPSRIHQRYRIQRDRGPPIEGLRRGRNHWEKGSVAWRERAKKSSGLLIPKAPAGHVRPAAGYSLCASRALEVAPVHARGRTHPDAGDWGKRCRLRNSECRPAALVGCERPAESLPASSQALDDFKLLTTSYPAYEDLRRRNTTFSGMAGFDGFAQ